MLQFHIDKIYFANIENVITRLACHSINSYMMYNASSYVFTNAILGDNCANFANRIVSKEGVGR